MKVSAELSSGRVESLPNPFFYIFSVCVRLTGREPGPGPRRLHLLPGVRQHVVALGLVDQVAARLRRLDQLLVVDHVEQVGRVDEGQAHGGQQLRQVLPKGRRRLVEGSKQELFRQAPWKTVKFSILGERAVEKISDVTKGTDTKPRKCFCPFSNEAIKKIPKNDQFCSRRIRLGQLDFG